MTTPHVGLFFSNLQGGGIQRVMLNLAKGLLARGWQVDLVLVQADGPLLAEIPASSRVFDLRAGHASRALGPLLTYLKTEKPAALLASQTHLNLAAILARLLSGWRGRLLVSEHIALDFAAQNTNNFKDRFYPLLAALFYRLADQVILVSQGSARHFLQATGLPPKLVRVIYNPITSEQLELLAHEKPAHPWFDLPGAPLLLAAGRLVPQKDFATMLRAFALLKTRLPQARLLILGEGPERAALDRLALELNLSDSLAFAGYLSNPFACMARASLFVLSSRWEGFGNVLVEALACGTPVVATDCPSGPAEILADGRYGLLAPVCDPQALADAIQLELQNPHDSRLLKERAADFSLERILPQYMRALQPGLEAQP